MASKLEPIKPVPALIAVAITLIIWFVIPVPEGVSPNAWQLLALFVGTIAAIIGKALPIGGVSIIAIALVAITGVTNPGDSKAALADALSGFSNDLIWLIGIAVMISISLKKTGLGSRIGYFLISLFGKRTIGIAYALSFAETILAPVTPSNTARGGGIIHPIMRSIASSFGSKPERGSTEKIGRYLALVNYNTNPITSAMFITATAPNPLIVSLIVAGTATG
ncbi:MAG: SLC13 family permease, partial [Flavobacterium sp.]